MRHIAAIMLCVVVSSFPVLADDLEMQLAASRDAVKVFGANLKSELQRAIKAGGAINGIAVCNEKAAQIAATTGVELGLQVGRTSLKVRNPDNSPDAWEQAVLRQFEERKLAGEAVTKMEFFQVVESKQNKTFRYMKAIPTATVCLGCHGDSISPEVSTRLNALYPDDEARGFQEGDIRGAFTITKLL